MSSGRVIAVFGGSRPLEGSQEYQEAFEVGCALAQEGFVVLNGGYAGTMEASAKGARAVGGRTVGVLSEDLAGFAPNVYLDETITREDLFSRIREMHSRSNGFIVLKGSMGTLAELALVWNLSKIDAQKRKPIVLLGDCWKTILNAYCEYLAVTAEEKELLQFASHPQEAINLLKRALRDGHDPLPRAPSPAD